MVRKFDQLRDSVTSAAHGRRPLLLATAILAAVMVAGPAATDPVPVRPKVV